MKRYARPHLVIHGTAADLTKGKTAIGTDSFFAGQTQPGEVCLWDTESQDCSVG